MITTTFTPANPETVSLGTGEVHLWRVSLADRPIADAALDPAELERIGRLVDPLKKARRLNCRAILREILGAYLNHPAAGVRLRTGPHGRPHLQASVHGSGLNFNLSHAGSLAVIALARAERLGVDIEAVRPLRRIEALLARCFSAAEARALKGRAAGEREWLFFRAWTAKEAVLKAEGTGIFHDPAAVEVSWEPGARVVHKPGSTAGWKLWEFVPAVGVLGTLALPAGAWTVRCLAHPGEFAVGGDPVANR